MYKNTVKYFNMACFGGVSPKEITTYYTTVIKVKGEAHLLNLSWQTAFSIFRSSLVNDSWCLSFNQLQSTIKS